MPASRSCASQVVKQLAGSSIPDSKEFRYLGRKFPEAANGVRAEHMGAPPSLAMLLVRRLQRISCRAAPCRRRRGFDGTNARASSGLSAMNLAILAGSANPALARAIAGRLGVAIGKSEVERFPDGEIHVEIHDTVRGHDVYLVQPTSPPADRHLMELLLLADACRRAGALRLTAIVPYLGYARQDRRAHGREAVGARVVADLFRAGRLDRVVAVDLHAGALEGFFAMPLEHLTAIPLLAKALRSSVDPQSVIVAPDLGAAKLADRYARLLGLPVAVIHKVRVSAAKVTARAVTGEVRGRRPLIVDDMISTGGTIEAAVEAVVSAGALPEVTVAATHGLFVGPAAERLRRGSIRRLIVTDSVIPSAEQSLAVEYVSIGPLLASAIDRLHRNESLDEFIAHA